MAPLERDLQGGFLFVAILWHMHQPWYQDPATGVVTLPWVRLHAAKDYVDMVALAEEFPAVHLTFNLTPTLLEQLAWYAQGGQDAWQALAARPTESLSPAEAETLARQCTFAHPQRMVAPHPRYDELVAQVRRGRPLTAQALRDLTVWFSLVWIDPRWRASDPALAALLAKGQGFTEDDKAAVLAAQQALIARVIPAYRDAQARGQIELTTSPYAHPILPLLMDTAVAREATPGLPLPKVSFTAPDDAAVQLRTGRSVAEQAFGRPPRGLWPSEGAVSGAILPAVAAAGFDWLATDEAILWKSLEASSGRAALYQPYRVAAPPNDAGQAGGRELAVIFRDRELSDLIGFTYAGQPAAQAADDFLRRLRQIHRETAHPAPLVAVILDGENAWEHYPEDGADFLRRLYDGLSREQAIRCVTISDYLAAHPPQAVLPRLAAGSWIRGDFTTWIGGPEKNRAWELLAQARAALPSDPSQDEAARHLLVAEGSDWFWWYGPEHTSADDAEFDRLFRQRLAQVYTALDQPVPAAVREPIGQAAPGGHVPPTGWITPTIDGLVTDYFEWLPAGRLDCAVARGAMAPGQEYVTRLWWGCDATDWYMRVDVGVWVSEGALALTILGEQPAFQLDIAWEGEQVTATWKIRRADDTWGPRQPVAKVAARHIVEFGIPLAALGVQHGQSIIGTVQVRRGDAVVETIPSSGTVTWAVPEESHAKTFWSA